MRILCIVIVCLAAFAVVPAPALAGPPEPVSPRGVVEQRCPTFSWSAVAGATGYELVVYRVSGEDVESEPFLSAHLPGGAVAWTPGGECLAAGDRYAWTLRVLGQEGDDAWAEPAIVRVALAPSASEVQAALATLRRYLAAERDGEAGAAGSERSARPRAAAPGLEEDAGPGGPLATAAAPTLGTPSLTVDGNVALGAASNFFKEGAVFLWDDTAGNTALGRLALASATGTATRNTALGRETLRYTVPGAAATDSSENTAAGDLALRSNTTGYHNSATGFEALHDNTTGFLNTATGTLALRSNTEGTSNTAMGAEALYSNLTGDRNTATGFQVLRSNTTGFGNSAHGALALSSNTSGYANTAMGAKALQNLTDGDRNVAVGYAAGSNATTGNDNVFLLNEGVAGDSGKIRIGTEGTQDAAFIAGIFGTTTGNMDAVTVMVDSAGQLGTVSSSRAVKQDVREIGSASERLLALRPVAFRYREHVARDPGTLLQFGLIAEEVARVFPELVVRDADGRPQTVKYHLLASLLLNELQRADEELADQGAELEALRRELAAVETRRDREGGPR